MYKIETHLHTCYCSSCGKLDARIIAEGYAKAGFHAITVTDHFSSYNWGKQDWPADRRSFSLARFFEGFYQVQEAAKPYGIKVYKGAEVRFDGSPNDYLVYNCPDALLEDPEHVFSMGLAAFHEQCAKAGGLVIQAHPFRGKCQPAEAMHLDGVEVRNMHPRHDSHNDLALRFANKHPHLLHLSGSDCHMADDIAGGGILTEVLPEDEAALAQLLRSGKYQML